MTRTSSVWRRLVRDRPLFSPGGFLVRAVLIGTAFLACHLLGLREYTTVMSGSAPGGDRLHAVHTVLGTAYALFYFGSTVAAPVLVIAAGLWWAAGWASRRAVR